MVIQGTPLVEPYQIGGSVEGVAGIPVGDLIDVVILTTPDALGSVIFANRFQTPPAAFGFLTDVFDENGDPPYIVSGLATPYFANGVLSPVGDYLEPTLGQIWPRIG